MKFSVASGALMQHLQMVAKAISSRSTSILPVLSNVLFELRGNVLTLTAADLNNRLTAVLDVTNEGEDGSFVVGAPIILDSLRELPDQPITIEISLTDYKATLTYSNGHYGFLGATADTYPSTITLSADERSVELSAEGMLAGLNATRFAASADDRRPIMTGVLMDFFSDKIVYVASDGRILVRYTDKRVSSPEPIKLCIPASVCKLLSGSLLPRESGNIRLRFDAKHLMIELGEFTLTARLLEGTYPAYNTVIPPSSPHHVVVDREALLMAAKRISVCANKASKLVLLDIDAKQIRLRANDIDFATAAEEFIHAESEDIDQLRIGFDFELLKVLLDGLQSEQVELALADQTRMGIITPLNVPEGVEVLSLIIPLKLIGDL